MHFQQLPREILEKIIDYVPTKEYAKLMADPYFKTILTQQYCFYKFIRILEKKPVITDWRRYDSNWLSVLLLYGERNTCPMCQFDLLKLIDKFGKEFGTRNETQFIWKPHCNVLTCGQYKSSGKFGEKKGNFYDYGCLRAAAVKANAFLFDNIGKNPKIIGEQSTPPDLPLSGDDLIIECCRYKLFDYRKIASQISPYIVLLSKDKNLCVKAAVHGIKPISNYTGSPSKLLNSVMGTEIERRSTEMSVENETFGDHEMELDSSGDDLYLVLSDLNAALVGCLSASLKKLFIQKFSLEWEDKTVKYPWLLSDIFQLLNTQILLLNLLDAKTKGSLIYFKRFAMDLERSLRREKSMFTKGDITKFLDEVVTLLNLCDHAGFPNDRIQATDILKRLQIKVNKL
ncbi:hypothetical protein HDV01_007006 [Terramyces sp. JEL0728]|nr:hypothetical protein HDV01_007006 [Terramyces sp. JEL0728]